MTLRKLIPELKEIMVQLSKTVQNKQTFPYQLSEAAVKVGVSFVNNKLKNKTDTVKSKKKKEAAGLTAT